jgi:hypothetical protein
MIVNAVELDKVRFGRGRFLAGVGAVLTTAAGAMWYPARASAACPLPGCHGYDMCPSCSGTQCTSAGCKGGYYGCESGTQCWRACISHNQYSCCDWAIPNWTGPCLGVANRCICRGFNGSC